MTEQYSYNVPKHFLIYPLEQLSYHFVQSWTQCRVSSATSFVLNIAMIYYPTMKNITFISLGVSLNSLASLDITKCLFKAFRTT